MKRTDVPIRQVVRLRDEVVKLRAELKRSYEDYETFANRTPGGCYDCGFAYGGIGWCDVMVPDDVWNLIAPNRRSKGGLLCFNCIARRIERLKLKNVRVAIVSGPFKRANLSQQWFGRTVKRKAAKKVKS